MIAPCVASMILQFLNVSSTFHLLLISATFFWLQDGGYTSGFSARGERNNTAQGPSHPHTGVLLL